MIKLPSQAEASPSNSIFLAVWEKMKKNGDLDGLSDEKVIEEVAAATEAIMADYDLSRRKK